MLAQRTSLFKSSGTAAARTAASEIVDLTAWEIWRDLAATIRDGAIDAIRKGVNRYTDPVGLHQPTRRAALRVCFENQGWAFRRMRFPPMTTRIMA
ncbi:aspartate aminotransferase [Mesorhizobium albiziae]|uniref:Aspartate aminotransferase n=1 Tax=Neomesorhizobium albiziae TaxID=335020 RepID=A0A1I4EH43_9HYPH|nr:aspartate aminotransferase [Mesorhizobium albiziae]